MGAPKYIKQLLTNKEKTDNNTIRAGNFNTPLTSMDTSSRRKSKKKAGLNEIWEEMGVINLYTTFHPNASEYILFSSAYGTFSRMHCMLGHKIKLNKYKTT